MEPLTELFLYEAARSEHAQHVIWPALHRGNWVICDRFTDATLAYQGAARGLSTDSIRYLNKVASGGLVPDLTIWLDFPPAEGLKKARARKYGRGDRLENEGVKFQKKVRGGYAAIARREPRRFRRVVVQDSIDATQELIRTLIEKRFL
jgi:dTMP kinase